MTDDHPDPPMPKIEDLLTESGWIRSLARQLVGDGRADDLVQEAWLVALRRAPRSPEAFRAWMSTILRRRARDAARGESRRRRREEAVSAPETSSAPAPDALHERLEMQRRLVEAVQRLAEPYRSTIVSRFFDGRATEEIARREGVAEPTVRSRVQRALALLREDLDRGFGSGGKRLAGIAALCALAYPEGQAAMLVAGGAGFGALLAGAGWLVKSVAAVLLVVGALAVGTRSFFDNPSDPPPASVEVADLAEPLPTSAIAPAAAPLLSGWVMDFRDLSPLAGATVTVDTGTPGGGRAPWAEVSTGADGSFAVPPNAVPLGSVFRLTVSLDGFAPERRDFAALPIAENDPIEIRLEPGIRVAGRVLLSDGRPASSGSVHLSGWRQGLFDWGRDVALVDIASDGHFSAWLAADEFHAVAVVPGFLPAALEGVSAELHDPEALEIRVERGGAIEGIVLGPSEASIAGAEIEILFPNELPWSGLLPEESAGSCKLVTDSAGRFRASGMPTWAREVRVRHPAFVEFREEDVHLEPEIRVVLESARTLTFDLEGDGGAIPPEHVVFEVRGAAPSLHPCALDDGRYRTVALPASGGEALLHVWGYRPHSIHWSAGAGVEDLGTIPLERGAELVLRFVDLAGKPVPRVPFFAPMLFPWPEPMLQGLPWPKELFQADETGVLRLGGLEPGTLFSQSPVEKVIPIAPGMNEQTIVLSRRSTGVGRIRGRIAGADPSGFFLQGTVVAAEEFAGMFESAVPWFEGEVSSGVELSLGLVVYGHAPVELAIPPLAPGERRDLGEVAVGPSVLGTVTGRTLAGSGEPIAGSYVSATPISGGAPIQHSRGLSLRTGRDGVFSLPLHPGRHRITWETNMGNYRAPGMVAEVMVEPGSEQEVTLIGAECRGYSTRLLYEDGTVPIDRHGCGIELRTEGGDWSWVETPRPDGSVRFDAVPDLPLELSVWRRGLGSPPGGAEVIAAGRPGDLPAEVSMPRGANLRVSVLGPQSGQELTIQIRGTDENRIRHEDERSSPDGILLSDLPGGRIEVSVRSDGFEESPWSPVELIAGVTSTLELTLSRIERNEITVEVVDERGRSIEGAMVAAYASGAWTGSRSGEAIVRGGAATISLPDVPHRWIVATAPGYAPAVARILGTDRSPRHRLTLGAEAWVDVRVFDAAGAPIRDALIRVESSTDHHDSGLGWEHLIGGGGVNQQPPTGHVRIDGLLGGWFRVCAKRGYETIAFARVELVAGEGRSVDLVVREPFRVRGRMTLDGAPVGKGHVSISGPGRTGQMAALDSEGRFEALVSFPGRHRFRYANREERDDFTHPLWDKTWNFDLERECEIELSLATATATIRFSTADGTPVAAAAGRFVGGKSFVTDERGIATVSGVEPGKKQWELDASPEGWFGSGLVELPSGESTTEIVLEAATDLAICSTGPERGTVVLVAEFEGSSFEIGEAPVGEPILARAPLRATAFLLRGDLEADGYRARVDRSRLEAAATDPIALAWSARLIVDVREEGEHVEGARVEVFSIGGPPPERILSKIFVGPPGRYRIRVTLPDGRERTTEFELDQVRERCQIDFAD